MAKKKERNKNMKKKRNEKRIIMRSQLVVFILECQSQSGVDGTGKIEKTKKKNRCKWQIAYIQFEFFEKIFWLPFCVCVELMRPQLSENELQLQHDDASD